MNMQARPLLQQALQLGNYDALVDPKLQKDYDSSEITRVIACAAACVNHSARHRPRMSQVTLMALKFIPFLFAFELVRSQRRLA